MTGYCPKCHKNVEMQNVETRKLRNEKFAHFGTCSEPKCTGSIFKKVRENQVEYIGEKKYPKEIHIGTKTPKALKDRQIKKVEQWNDTHTTKISLKAQ